LEKEKGEKNGSTGHINMQLTNRGIKRSSKRMGKEGGGGSENKQNGNPKYSNKESEWMYVLSSHQQLLPLNLTKVALGRRVVGCVLLPSSDYTHTQTTPPPYSF
jgi:hypothetical protein